MPPKRPPRARRPTKPFTESAVRRAAQKIADRHPALPAHIARHAALSVLITKESSE